MDLMTLLETVLGSPWLFLLILTATAVDVLFPIVPAEALLITAGVYAVSGTPNPWLLIAAACLGAIIGDYTAHQMGRGTGRLSRRLLRSQRGSAIMVHAQRAFDKRGGSALIAGRFIPGGRTATTLVSGMLRYPRHRFLIYSSVGAVTWAIYSTGIGMLGGMVFHEQPLLGVVVGVGIALGSTGLVEGARYLIERRKSSSRVVGPPGLEPGTSGLKVRCSAN